MTYNKRESASVRLRHLASGGVSYQVVFKIDGVRKSTSFTSSPAAEMFASVVRYFGATAALDFLTESAPRP